MTRDKFYTKKGRLTRYSLACGYTEETTSGSVQLILWAEGGPLIHVKAYDFEKCNRLFWESFESLTAARKFYDKMKKELLCKQKARC